MSGLDEESVDLGGGSFERKSENFDESPVFPCLGGGKDRPILDNVGEVIVSMVGDGDETSWIAFEGGK